MLNINRYKPGTAGRPVYNNTNSINNGLSNTIKQIFSNGNNNNSSNNNNSNTPTRTTLPPILIRILNKQQYQVQVLRQEAVAAVAVEQLRPSRGN